MMATIVGVLGVTSRADVVGNRHRWRGAYSVAVLCLLAATVSVPGFAVASPLPDFPKAVSEVSAGSFTRIYNPTLGVQQGWGQRRWYINDHTIVRAADGTWHLFGITHTDPAAPTREHHFAHATAPSLHGPWTMQSFALNVDPKIGETHLWAPYVLQYHGTWYMFYASGGPDLAAAGISVATSPDLWHWTRYKSDPVFRDGYAARDPFVVRVGNQWVMYYDATSHPTGGRHVVAYRTSTDLLHWSHRHIAYVDPSMGKGGGNTESPYVIRHDGYYYLFIGPRPGYVGTAVFRSSDPFHFLPSQWVGHIASHALEAVKDGQGRWWVTSAGWGQGGVELAPLRWDTPVKYRSVSVCTGLSASSVPHGLRLVDPPGVNRDVREGSGAAAKAGLAPVSGIVGTVRLRFGVDDNVAFDGRASSVLESNGYTADIRVRYMDAGTGSLSIIYDSNNTKAGGLGAYTKGPSVHLVKSPKWKVARMTLKDARFANRENGGADFTIKIKNSDGKLLIKNVAVTIGGYGIIANSGFRCNKS